MIAGPTIDPGAYSLVGMGAFFGGFLRCPMAAVLIVLELTNDYVENVDRCPVVATDGSKRVVGFLSPADLVRARFRQQAAGAERADITLF